MPEASFLSCIFGMKGVRQEHKNLEKVIETVTWGNITESLEQEDGENADTYKLYICKGKLFITNLYPHAFRNTGAVPIGSWNVLKYIESL